MVLIVGYSSFVSYLISASVSSFNSSFYQCVIFMNWQIWDQSGWKLLKLLKLLRLLRYNYEVFVLHWSISMFCYFIRPLHFILKKNTFYSTIFIRKTLVTVTLQITRCIRGRRTFEVSWFDQSDKSVIMKITGWMLTIRSDNQSIQLVVSDEVITYVSVWMKHSTQRWS